MDWQEDEIISDGKGEYILFKDEAYQIFGAAIEVHKELGPGFLEAIYQEALELELDRRRIPFSAQPVLSVFYKGIRLKKTYQPDFICYGQIVVEIKAQDHLSGIEDAQVLNYLKATGYRLGLLINFGSVGVLERKRIIR